MRTKDFVMTPRVSTLVLCSLLAVVAAVACARASVPPHPVQVVLSMSPEVLAGKAITFGIKVINNSDDPIRYHYVGEFVTVTGEQANIPRMSTSVVYPDLMMYPQDLAAHDSDSFQGSWVPQTSGRLWSSGEYTLVSAVDILGPGSSTTTIGEVRSDPVHLAIR